MAQPISMKQPARDPKQELLERLEKAPAEHAAALLDGYQLVEELHQHGVFTILRGLFTASDKLVMTAADEAAKPEAIRFVRNSLLLVQMLSSIDPEALQGACVAVSQTFGNAKAVAYKPPSFLGLFTGFLSRDLRRGMGLINTFLKNLAYQLKIRTKPAAHN
jgi:uncharacterized protein YjgD (DUF1641 family)